MEPRREAASDAPGRLREAAPENNTFFGPLTRTSPQFTYIHKSVYGSSAFA
jgi:hypothetical protein